MKTSVLVSTVAAVFFSAGSFAKDLPPALEFMVNSGSAKILKTFETEKKGLTGYVIDRSNGDPVIVYGMGDYAMAGVLINSKGDNLTNRYADKYIPKPDHSEIVDQLRNDSHLVVEGSATAPEMYVFADANCHYCKKFFAETRDLVAEGKLRLNWVMVAFLAPSSENIASAIFEGGVDVLKKAELADSPKTAPKVSVVPDEHAKALEAHRKAMSDAGLTGTPGLLYQVDGRWESKSGVPSRDSLEKLIQSGER